MHRIVRLLPSRQVAAGVAAIGRRSRQCVVVVDVAGSASHIGVSIGERKTRRVVIERGRSPAHRCVTCGAVRKRKRWSGRRMDRIVRLLPGAQVAPRISAIGRRNRQIVVVVQMAGSAWHVGMAVGQQKTRRAVVEIRVQPCVKRGVAGLASGREFCRHVIGIDGLLIIRQVAGRARRRKSDVLSGSRVLVALLAFHNGVRSEEGESIEMLLHRVHRNLPAEGTVTLGTISAKLAAVNIGMAIRAVLTHIREDRLEVTFGAVNFFVHAAQRVSRAVVVEFRNGANRRPTGAGVAIFAGNRKRTVRTPAGLPLSGRR